MTVVARRKLLAHVTDCIGCDPQTMCDVARRLYMEGMSSDQGNSQDARLENASTPSEAMA